MAVAIEIRKQQGRRVARRAGMRMKITPGREWITRLALGAGEVVGRAVSAVILSVILSVHPAQTRWARPALSPALVDASRICWCCVVPLSLLRDQGGLATCGCTEVNNELCWC